MQTHPRTFALHFKCSAQMQVLWSALQTAPGAGGEQGGVISPLVIRTSCADSTADNNEVPHCIPLCLACLVGEERWDGGSSAALLNWGLKDPRKEKIKLVLHTGKHVGNADLDWGLLGRQNGESFEGI